MDIPPPAPPHPSLLSLARAWPEAVADPALAAAYERALDGLDPGAVEAAVASLSRDGRPAPSPGMLRTVVLARAAAPRAAPVTAAPGIGSVSSGTGPGSGVPPEGRRLWTLLLVSAAFAIAGVLLRFAPALTLRGATDGRHMTFSAADPWRQLVLGPLVVVLAAVLLGRAYMRRRRPARHVRGAFLLVGLLGALGAFSAAMSFVTAEWLRREFSSFRGPGVQRVEVLVEWGVWASLLMGLAALAAAIYAAITMSRGPGRWIGDASYRPPAWQRWTARGAGVVCVLFVALIVVGIVGESTTTRERAANPDVAARTAANEKATTADAGVQYLRIVADTNRRMDAAYAALEVAIRANDPARMAPAVRRHVAIATSARRRLTTIHLPRSAQPAMDGMVVALGRQISAYRALANQLERYGTLTDAAVAEVDAAEGRTASAAARLQEALGVPTDPI